ncbi:MAG: hypothetical protein U0359_18740 [Byssovorax sp.]
MHAPRRPTSRAALIASGALVTLATLVACGGGSSPSTSSTTTTTSSTTGGTGGSGGSSGTGGSGGSGGGTACPPGSHPGAISPCEAVLTSWDLGPPLKHKRDHHVTFVSETPAGAFLYVVAGMGSVAPALPMERAPIAADGTLGSFTDIGNVPAALIGPGLAQVGRSFVLGGGLGADSNSSAATYVGQVGDDGKITLTPGPDLGASRYHVSLAYVKGFVFALGGLFQQVNGGMVKQEIVDTIERATFDGTTLSAFTMMPPLPVKLTHHATLVHNDAIYVIGGGSDVAALPDIRRATVSDAGELGPWETVGQLPEGRGSPSALVFLDQLYVIAGMASLTGGEQATVLRGPIGAAGQVGAFEVLDPLPMARAHSHQTPLYAGHLYSTGGSIKHVPQNQVYIGTLQ